MGIKSQIFKKQFEKKNKKMFFNDPFYTTNFSPRYNTISKYANRTCNCPECRPSARRVPVQQSRREMPRRRQVPDRQINVPNPEEYFHLQNQTLKEPRKKSRKPQKTVRKPFQNPSRPQISTTIPEKLPPKSRNPGRNRQCSKNSTEKSGKDWRQEDPHRYGKFNPGGTF